MGLLDDCVQFADRALPQIRKSLEDAQWTDLSNLGEIGNVSVEAANAQEKSLAPKQQYELSIAVNAAINAIARNISKARWRIFAVDGDSEVMAGPLYELLRQPAPGISMRRFTSDVVCWYNVAGEWRVLKDVDEENRVRSLLCLDPYRLEIDRPKNPPESNSDVTKWKYYFLDGTHENISSLELMGDMMFNPNGGARGLSPLITGQIEVTTGYHAGKYNKNFFENAGIPSHIVNIGEGVSRRDREDFKKRYLAEYTPARMGAHKVMVVSGAKEIQVETLEHPFQDGAFMELRKWSVAQVAMLYHVPAIEMGLYDKTRFDTASEERKLFVESTLMPQMDALSEAFQYQLVEPHYRMKDVGKTKAVMTKAVQAKFDELRESRPDAKYVLLLDPDTLPVMASVKAAQISVAKDFRETLDLSAKETADYFKLDIPDREERNDVWKNKTYVNIPNPEFNAKLLPPAPVSPLAGQKQPPKPAGRKPDKAKIKAVEKSMRELRKLALSALDGNELFSLESADELIGDDYRKSIRRIRHELRRVLDEPDPKRCTKDYFNQLDCAAIAGSIYEN